MSTRLAIHFQVLLVLALGPACSGADSGPADGSDDTRLDDDGAATDSGQANSGAVDSGAADSGASDTGMAGVDVWEAWPATTYFPTFCGACHPGKDGASHDWREYSQVVDEQEHIRCGTAPEQLPDCPDHIEPGHLPIGDGPFPTEDERWRLVAWFDDGMLRESDLD